MTIKDAPGDGESVEMSRSVGQMISCPCFTRPAALLAEEATQ
jgi:hypothetical protein